MSKNTTDDKLDAARYRAMLREDYSAAKKWGQLKNNETFEQYCAKRNAHYDKEIK